ncbi:oxidoreductase [Lutimonas saemankumensis]|uniref:WD40/YVTN/BNR-like repeat-containing protein n=1 Tax=Lutimonas saemankumensis TaxID=483016 RepID=UPI001CD1B931|nr:oxidoreductase [Lutimonas saemankumensis]MCA0931632.1 oxidoreductase [Lutimonas saemankumensis]
MMRTIKVLVISFLFSISYLNAQGSLQVSLINSFKLPGTSIRAIEVTGENTIWFAGSGGKYGKISHDKIEMDSISFEGRFPQFRSIAYNGKHIFILSIENPALLYRIDPNKPLGHRELVYKEIHEKVFYDSMLFIDENFGIAMGDPVENCLSVIRTSDGGNTWQKTECADLPTVSEGEAAFAASNTNLAAVNDKVWIVTGGTKARVFISDNKGESWSVRDTPVMQGGKMTGIFTTDFYDENNGIIMGGNWEEKKNGLHSKALTSDGGKNWTSIDSDIPGYISCVQYVPGSKGRKLVAVSTEGLYFSENKGKNWKKIHDTGYYSLRFAGPDEIWLSGHEEIVKIKLQ